MSAQVPDNGGRHAGMILAAATLSGIIVMALHPHGAASGPNLAELVSGSAHLSGANAIIHGMMIALVFVWIFALSILATRLGSGHLSVRAGLVAYVLGAGALMVAALISGFVGPETAALIRTEAGRVVPPEIGKLLWATNQELSKLGTIAASLGIAVWSIGFLKRTDVVTRLTGGLGLVTGAALSFGTLTAAIGPSLLGMTFIVAAHGVWNLAASALLITRRI